VEDEVKLVSTAEMQAVEGEANSKGLSYAMMMEQAGTGLAEHIEARYSTYKASGILGLVGSGNNGGDALVALAKMVEWGWKATAYIVGSRPKDDPLIERLISSGGEILDVTEDKKFKILKSALAEHAILMDGILGTGINLPLRGAVKEVLEYSNKALSNLAEKPIVVAVDCPSGVDSDTGEASPDCIAADLTVTMAAVKRGMLEFPANDLIGELSLVGIGLKDKDKRSKTWQGIKRRVVSSEWVSSTLPRRERDAHKGTFGTAMIIAGSVNYTGAALLSGKAAYRVGAGLVTLGVASPLHLALAGQIPEATWLLLPHEMGVIDESAAEVVFENLGKASAMLLGPGLGVEETTRKFLINLLMAPPTIGKPGIGFVTTASKETTSEKQELPPLVVDADGLKLLASIPAWASKLPGPAVLTPHPGEMAVLTDLQVSEIQSERIATAEKYAGKWGHVVVLKGANTVIAEPGGRTAVIPVANPALASAGSGDVLAGIIVGLRAQGMEAYESAVSGSWIHAQSGVKSAKSLGTNTSVIAGDLLSSMVEVIQDLQY
jgi:NAD(P)H-hydrate epimerase